MIVTLSLRINDRNKMQEVVDCLRQSLTTNMMNGRHTFISLDVHPDSLDFHGKYHQVSILTKAYVAKKNSSRNMNTLDMSTKPKPTVLPVISVIKSGRIVITHE